MTPFCVKMIEVFYEYGAPSRLNLYPFSATLRKKLRRNAWICALLACYMGMWVILPVKIPQIMQIFPLLLIGMPVLIAWQESLGRSRQRGFSEGSILYPLRTLFHRAPLIKGVLIFFICFPIFGMIYTEFPLSGRCFIAATFFTILTIRFLTIDREIARSHIRLTSTRLLFPCWGFLRKKWVSVPYCAIKDTQMIADSNWSGELVVKGLEISYGKKHKIYISRASLTDENFLSLSSKIWEVFTAWRSTSAPTSQ